MKTDSRRGFTLVELLVVITIIGMLMALLIPAVNSARGIARRNTCLNNMRQAGTAIVSYENAKQRYPGYAQSVKRGAGNWVAIGGGGQLSNSMFQDVDNANASRISWAGVIAPFIEGQQWWDAAVEPGNQFPIGPLEIYICPSDIELTALAENAGLSYVINAGAWDYDSASASDVSLNSTSFLFSSSNTGDTDDNGLCHNHVAGRSSVKTTMSGIRDGAGTTLLLSENTQKNQNYCWFGVSPPRVPEQYFGMVWVATLNPTNDSGVLHQWQIGQEPTIDFNEASPDFARPAANHGGSFNVVFAEGHGRALDQDIDYIVYQQLLTPNGRKCVDPVDHNNPQRPEAMTAFRNSPPISVDALP